MSLSEGLGEGAIVATAKSCQMQASFCHCKCFPWHQKWESGREYYSLPLFTKVLFLSLTQLVITTYSQQIETLQNIIYLQTQPANNTQMSIMPNGSSGLYDPYQMKINSYQHDQFESSHKYSIKMEEISNDFGIIALMFKFGIIQQEGKIYIFFYQISQYLFFTRVVDWTNEIEGMKKITLMSSLQWDLLQAQNTLLFPL